MGATAAGAAIGAGVGLFEQQGKQEDFEIEAKREATKSLFAPTLGTKLGSILDLKRPEGEFTGAKSGAIQGATFGSKFAGGGGGQ